MPVKRLNYFDQQFLKEADFKAEQDYHLTMRRLNTRLAFTHGIAEGLVVTQAQTTSVTVSAGSAIDGKGQEIVLDAPVNVDLATQPAGDVWLTIRYDQQQTDPGGGGNTRWTEAPKIEGATSAPSNPATNIVLARVVRSGTTVTQIDTAGRVVTEPRQLAQVRQDIAARVKRSGDAISGGLSVAGGLTVGAGGNATVSVRHINGKHYLNDNPDPLYLNHATGHPVVVGHGAKPASLHVSARIGTNGYHPETGLPPGWGGGLHTWDVYAEATIAAGRNGAVAAYMNADGHIVGTGDLHVGKGRTIHNAGRMHVHPQERLYLLAKDGVWITSDWGARGSLFVLPGATDPSIPSWSPGGVVTWDVFARGWVYTGGLNASVKKFVIDHPADESRRLEHASLEGPEIGVYYRGEAVLEDGEATVELPGYFEALTRAGNRTVLVTPRLGAGGEFTPLAASAVEDGRFRVAAAPGGDPAQAFFWEVKAIRGDLDELEVEPLRDREPALS